MCCVHFVQTSLKSTKSSLPWPIVHASHQISWFWHAVHGAQDYWSCAPHPCVNPCSPLDPVFLSMDLLGLPSAPMQLARGAIGAGDPCVRAVCHYAHISCAIADARSWHPDPCYMTYCLYIQAKYCRHYCLFHYIQSPWTFMGVQLKQFIETSAKWLLTCPVAFTCALHLFACSYHDVKLQ